MSILPKRLQVLEQSPQEFFILPKDKVLQEIMNLQKLIQNPLDKLSLASYIDTSNMEVKDVKAWLKNLALDDKPVYAYWLSENEGIIISFKLFTEHYDDLWYPAMDDVVLTPTNTSWVLVLDHEEQFQLWRHKKQN